LHREHFWNSTYAKPLSFGENWRTATLTFSAKSPKKRLETRRCERNNKTMSVFDSKDLMSFKGAAREYDVPVTTLELAATQGALRVFEQDGARWLLRPSIEQFVKRTVKNGAGNRVVSKLNPQ
jgi:hypothetical protein